MKIVKVSYVKYADTFSSRLIGYMFQTRPYRSEVKIFENCKSIHTFNMRFSLDILFLDSQNRVIKRFLSVPSGRILKSVKGAQKVVEAPSGLFNSIEEDEVVLFEGV
ncbi:DUF192 domain-containing protein [Fusibacter bizertensis]|uniref:DUF192 domain-containing protein n=1 Tax=Fusibacter bizertensis TaxID=1488331 RepID=A0ABT6NA69_9FIRM|nr:DUF192 domain-containing protein [Fusibacter bizertensis]MDH8677306.1 DUF192 domain-containing protein [Fusibacter bizertensis]